MSESRLGWLGRWAALQRTLWREPLVHFLIAGALLLVISEFMRSGVDLPDRIVVSAADIQQLRETWSSRWGQSPNASQMQTLVDDSVREEVLYREAIASGLDQNDAIVRRRLAQKMEFLAQGVAAAVEPTEAELTQFFERQREDYATPATVSFTHVYFSEFHRGASGERAAREALMWIRSEGIATASAVTLGDTFMLQHDYPPQTRDAVRRLFGEDFVARLFELSPGRWEGPIRSSYGLHLVRVVQASAARVPGLGEVRDRVMMEFKAQYVRQVTDAYYEDIRRRYRVEVDERALGAGS